MSIEELHLPAMPTGVPSIKVMSLQIISGLKP